MMTLRTMEELMAHAEFFALQAMLATGTCRPCLFFTNAEGQPGFFMHGNGEFNEAEIDGFVQMARMVTLANAAIACVFISEIWVSVADVRPGESGPAAAARIVKEKGMPSEDFERREMIMFAGESFDRRVCKVLPIVRSDNGKFFNFGESDVPMMDTAKGDQYDGRFAHILTTRQPPPQVQELAKLFLKLNGLKPMKVAMPMEKSGGKPDKSRPIYPND